MSRRLQRFVIVAIIVVLVLGLLASFADATPHRIQYDSRGPDYQAT